jgi:DNA topoisomerase-1
MRVAQGLYEGVEVEGTLKGLITYMRTDSLRLSPEAKEMAKNFIFEKYGEKYWGNEVEKKDKNAKKIQDAHEAIRPTDVYLIPNEIKKFLNEDQYKLYKLIWERFLISQFAKMEYEQFEILSEYDNYEFRGAANKITFDGYYKIFKDEDEIKTIDFPAINVGDKFDLMKLNIVEGETKPPAKLTESTLVKKLEADGIGRPSTYASIIDTLKKREYVILDGKKFTPTELGYEIKNILEKNFPNIMNIKFTAEMEEKLDHIEEGELQWKKVLKEFYDDLEKYLKVFAEEAERLANIRVESDVICHGPMVMKTGRFGKYLQCENEECGKKINLKGVNIPKDQIEAGMIYVKEVVEEKEKARLGEPTDLYSKDGKMFFLKLGRFGSYLESEDFANDEVRESLPTEIRKMLALKTVERVGEVVQLKKIMDAMKAEEAEILKTAGVCEKCGSPFEVKRGKKVKRKTFYTFSKKHSNSLYQKNE